MKNLNWKKYAFEFLSIFIAVISAFALNNWNDNRRDRVAEIKILTEIYNGLELDIQDIKVNKKGHQDGLAACLFFKELITNDTMVRDSLGQKWFDLTRDYISIQNISGYESLKSRGLELIKNDSLRLKIIKIYEYDFNVLRKFEEEYQEMQYQQSYFRDLNNLLAPRFVFDENLTLLGVKEKLDFSEKEKNMLFSYLWKIAVNRSFIVGYYQKVEEEVIDLRDKIGEELDLQ